MVLFFPFQSNVSQHAPSASMDTRQTILFSYEPLPVLLRAFADAIKKAQFEHMEPDRGQLENLIVSHGDAVRDVTIHIGCYDSRKQKLLGEVWFRSETGLAAEDEDVTMTGASQDRRHLGYLINFVKARGDPMEWTRRFLAVKGFLPAGLVVQ
jgi:hypothetical protein